MAATAYRTSRPATCQACAAETDTPMRLLPGEGWLVPDHSDGSARWRLLCEHHYQATGGDPHTARSRVVISDRHAIPAPEATTCALCDAAIDPFEGHPAQRGDRNQITHVQVCHDCFPRAIWHQASAKHTRREQALFLRYPPAILSIATASDPWTLLVTPGPNTITCLDADVSARRVLAGIAGDPDPLAEVLRAVRAGAVLWRRRNRWEQPRGSVRRGQWNIGATERRDCCTGDAVKDRMSAWRHCHSVDHVAALFGISEPNLVVQAATAIHRDPALRPLTWD